MTMSLDAEDKRWISEQMRVLSEHVAEQMRVLSEHVAEQMHLMSEHVAEQMHLMSAKLESVETSLLTEFHKWASPTEARLRTHTATMRAVDLEMEALSERVKKLEDRQ